MDKHEFHPFTFDESSPLWQMGRPGRYTAWIRGRGNHGHFSWWSGSAWCIAAVEPEEVEPTAVGFQFDLVKMIYFPAKVSLTTAERFGQRAGVMAAQGVLECLYPGSSVEIFSPQENVARQLIREWKASANVPQWNELYRAIDRYGFRVRAQYDDPTINADMYETLDRMIREEADRLLAINGQQ